MATNLKHNFEDTHISLNVIEPTNVTGNDAHIARKFWTDQEKPVVNNQPVSKDTKNSWYGQFMSCMEIDWGNAKGDDENNFDKSTISESAIRDILFTNGIKTSDELLTVLCWLFRNRYVAPLPIYSITWNGNGATINASGGSSSVTQGETVTIPTTAPIREYTLIWNGNNATTNASTDGSKKMEYTFNNWWTDDTDGDQVTNATVPTGDSTYFAHWTPNDITLPKTDPKREYTITWENTYATTNASDDGSKKMEYTFNNWWTLTSGGDQVTTKTTTTVNNTTYYAHWTPNAITLPSTNPKREYSIKWDDNGATTPHSGGTTEVTYTFNNWWTSASGGTKVTTNITPTANAKYYPHWTAPTGITLPTTNPTRSGYTFKGWAESNSATTPNVTTKTIPTSGVTYYAVWEASINYYYYAGWTLPDVSNVDTIIAEEYPSASGSSIDHTAGKKTTSKSTMDYTSNTLYNANAKATYYVLVPTGHAIYDPLDNNIVGDLFTSKGNITIGNQTHTIYEYNGTSRNINAIIIK